MISILIYCHDEKHMEEIHELCKYNTVLMGNEELAVLKYSGDESPSEAASRESTSIDLVFYEICTETDVEELKKIRLLYEEAEIMIMASLSIPTNWYLIPDIRPVMFLSEPSNKITKNEQVHDFFVFFYRKRMKNHFEDTLVIDIKKDKRYLNLNRIICLEACEKKIKIYYDQEQIHFYGSLKELEKKLPSNFIRCHRSFIVNSTYISRMNISQNNFLMREKLVIPISKKYKNKVIQLLKQGIINREIGEYQS